jgi:hypothetical protein
MLSIVWLLLSIAASFATEIAVSRGVRAVLLAHQPLSGDHVDSKVYERSLATPDELDLVQVWTLLGAAGVAMWVGFGSVRWLAFVGVVLWLLALAMDLHSWQRVAASVKFVSWRRGWRKSARRLAIAQVREVHVVERASDWRIGSHPLPLTSCYVALVLRDGKAVKLPRTGTLFGGLDRVEDVANFVRTQLDIVNDMRRRAVAEKRLAARRAMRDAPSPVHPSAKTQAFSLPPSGRG